MATCLHLNKNGTNCGNKKIFGSEYCYLKSHYPNTEIYENTIESHYQNFVSQTLEHNDFTVTDVIGDGACLYRCFVVYLLKNLHLLVEHNQEIYLEFFQMINEYFQLKLENNNLQITNWTSEEYQSKIKEIIEQKMVETNYLIVNKLAKYLQVKIKDWLVANKNMPIEDLGGFPLEQLIENCHDINLEQYDFLYNIFAGDLDYILVKLDDEELAELAALETGVIEDIDDENGKKDNNNENKEEDVKYKKVNIPDRWGSTSEIYGFSGLFNVNVNVYVIKRFDKKRCDVVLGKKVVKSSRFELYQRVSLRSDTPKMNEELDVLLIERKGFPHYQYLDKKTNNI